MPFFAQFLDTVGDGTGVTNASVDGSTTPVVFKITPAANEVLDLTRLIIKLEVMSIISESKYGDLPELTNGIQLIWESGYGIFNITQGSALNTTFDWNTFCYEESSPGGIQTKSVSFQWQFSESRGPIRIFPGGSFKIVIQDDLSGLVSHVFFVHGFRTIQPSTT